MAHVSLSQTLHTLQLPQIPQDQILELRALIPLVSTKNHAAKVTLKSYNNKQ